MINIIGGSGFVGSRLISLLKAEGCINIDKKQSLQYPEITTLGDIRKLDDIVINQDCSFVVLLAAEHRDDVTPENLYYDVNVQGTKNVLKKMDQAGVKNLLFASSVAVYGLNKNNPNEGHPCDPFNHYGKSKLEAELAIKKWYDNDPSSKSVTIIRPTVIFGERNRGNVYNLLKQISSGRFMMIGKGRNKKSMAYVGNIVALFSHLLDNSEMGYRVFNYADDPDLSMTELVSLVERKVKISTPKLKIPFWIGLLGGYGFDLLSLVSRKRFSVSSIRVKKFCATTQFDATKAHSNFKAPYSLKEGLDLTLEHEFLNSREDDILFCSE